MNHPLLKLLPVEYFKMPLVAGDRSKVIGHHDRFHSSASTRDQIRAATHPGLGVVPTDVVNAVDG